MRSGGEDEGTAAQHKAHVETMLRRHAYPTLGDRSLSSIIPSDIQAWVKGLELAPATVRVVHGIVSTVMKTAIRDRRIASNPCDGTKLPKVQRKQIVPLTTEQVESVRASFPHSYRRSSRWRRVRACGPANASA